MSLCLYLFLRQCIFLLFRSVVSLLRPSGLPVIVFLFVLCVACCLCGEYSNNFSAEYVFVTNLRDVKISTKDAKHQCELWCCGYSWLPVDFSWFSIHVGTKYYQHCSPSSNDAFSLHVVPMNTVYHGSCHASMSSILGKGLALLWAEPARQEQCNVEWAHNKAQFAKNFSCTKHMTL